MSNNRMPSTTCHANVAALSSASAVEIVDTVCLDERQTMMEPPREMINPDWDLVSEPAKPASDHANRSVKSPVHVITIP